MQTITHVTVALLNIPKWGRAVITPNLTDEDRAKVSSAAEVLGMSQNQFARTAVVRVAEKILEEAGITSVAGAHTS